MNYNIEKYPDRWQQYVEFAHTQVDELMTDYGSVDILWLDGGWVRPLSAIEASISNFVDPSTFFSTVLNSMSLSTLHFFGSK